MSKGAWQELRYALRGMRRSPGFTAVAVLSLAMGIGASTGIFSLLHTLMLRSLPVPEPRQLVEFLNQYPGDPPLNVFSVQSYEYFRDHNRVFAGVTGVRPSRFHVRGTGLELETVEGEVAAGNFFQVMGVKPAAGRLLVPGDSAAAVLSWSCWKNRFSLDPGVVGRRLVVDDAPLTVVGVTPREFQGVQVGFRPDIWVPLAIEPAGGRAGPLQLIARLRPGVSIEQARAEMAVLFRFTLEERSRGSKDPLQRQLKFTVEPAGGGLATGLRNQFGKPLVALMAVVGLLLLITCTNLANMLLARGAARRHEMAVRVALGAGRLRLMRQVLTESLVLSAMGGAIGIFLAFAGAGALVRIMLSGRPPIGPSIDFQVHPDAPALLFTGGIALATGLLFGMAPAWRAFTPGMASALRAAGRVGETRRGRLFSKSLVVAQLALTVGMLSAAGLFIGHLSNLEQIDLGFRRDHVLLATLDAARSGFSGEQLSFAYQELLGRLAAIPGVRSATMAAPTPLSGAGASRMATVEGYHERPEDRRYIAIAWVAPRYFETLGMPLLMGRDFSFTDRRGPRAAIVNRALATHYFGGASPIGKHLTLEGDNQPFEIVGVAGDAKYQEIREPTRRTVYLDTFQFPQPAGSFAISTSVNPQGVAPAVRRIVRESLKTVPVVGMTTLNGQVDASIVPERLIATLSGLFGALGSLLAVIGVYGLLAYTVAGRASEIGVRMALGATPGTVYRMVLREALWISSAGLAIGIAIAWWGERLAAGLSPDLPRASAFPIVFGAITLVAITLAAAYLPARRAARVDPAGTLRHD